MRVVETRSATKLVPILQAEGVRTKTGRPVDKGAIYRRLNNRLLIGEIAHKGNIYQGEHASIVSRRVWDEAHEIMAESSQVSGSMSAPLARTFGCGWRG